jgi:enamine deaminase RidA (YjgF/YER057c/UK114 family)
MTDLTRRQSLALSAALVGGEPQAASTGSCVTIERIEPGPSGLPGVPLISWATAHGDMVHLSGITDDPRKPGADVAQQTRAVLRRIDALLAEAGSHKSKVLSATVWLTDMENFARHNDAWNEWVDADNRPARACLVSPQLWRPNLLVEIMAVAAR